MYHQLLKRTFFLMTLCGSVMLSAGDDAWSKSCGWPRKLDNLTWCKMPVN